MIIFTRTPFHFSYFFLILVSTALFFGCEPKNDEDLVPSYISIDQINVSSNAEQGSPSSKITDAWVYLNDILVGSFELPATIPVLASGKQTVIIRPGIKLNGISNTRAAYPFYSDIKREINLVKDSVIALTNLTVTYRSNIIFPWQENFELSGFSFDTTSSSTVDFIKTDDLSRIFPEQDNSYSGLVQLTGDTAIFEAATKDKYQFPASGDYVFLEMNYKNNAPLVVGVIYMSENRKIQRPLVVLNETDEWNKVYVNLTVPKYDTPSAYDFQIFLGAEKKGGSNTPEILIDNLKLLHFNN